MSRRRLERCLAALETGAQARARAEGAAALAALFAPLSGEEMWAYCACGWRGGGGPLPPVSPAAHRAVRAKLRQRGLWRILVAATRFDRDAQARQETIEALITPNLAAGRARLYGDRG